MMALSAEPGMVITEEMSISCSMTLQRAVSELKSKDNDRDIAYSTNPQQITANGEKQTQKKGHRAMQWPFLIHIVARSWFGVHGHIAAHTALNIGSVVVVKLSRLIDFPFKRLSAMVLLLEQLQEKPINQFDGRALTLSHTDVAPAANSEIRLTSKQVQHKHVQRQQDAHKNRVQMLHY